MHLLRALLKALGKDLKQLQMLAFVATNDFKIKRA